MIRDGRLSSSSAMAGTGASTPPTRSATLSAVAHRIDVPLQAMEDALCNWQKH
jgi:hypothetical protein